MNTIHKRRLYFIGLLAIGLTLASGLLLYALQQNINAFLTPAQLATAHLPADYTTRKYDLFWKYKLPKQKHTVRIKLIQPNEKQSIQIDDLIIYSDKRADTSHK